MKTNNKNLVIRIIFTTLLVVFATIFIYIPKNSEMVGAMSFLTDMDKFYINDKSNGIVLENLYPVSDKTGMKSTSTEFDIVNDTNKEINYKVVLLNNETEEGKKYLDLTNLRYSVSVNGSEYSEAMSVNEDGTINISTVNANSENSYSLKLWIDYNSGNEVYGSLFNACLTIERI